MTGTSPARVTPEMLAQWPLPDVAGDKESRGRVLVVGGTSRTPGAALLAGEAALRAGGGKLQIATAPSACLALAVAVPEAAVIDLHHQALTAAVEQDSAAAFEAVGAADTVIVGPGLDDPDAVPDLVERVLDVLSDGSRLVLDALGSAFLTQQPEGLGEAAGRTVVTVNPNELAHILDLDPDAVARDLAGATAEVAQRTGAVVLGGGEDKHVAHPDGRAWHATAGGPGLGVSGSGDVQAGIVGGLLARCKDPAQAAVWGAHVHGTAGEAVARRVGGAGLLARELPAEVPRIVADLGG